MKQTEKIVAGILMVVAIMTMSMVAFSAPVKKTNIKVIKTDYYADKIAIQFKNPTKQVITIEKYGGIYRGSCVGAVVLCNSKWKVIDKVTIPKGKTKTIRFIRPNNKHKEFLEDSRKFAFNYSVGDKKYNCVIAAKKIVNREYDEYDGYYKEVVYKYNKKATVRLNKGFKKIPYKQYLYATYENFKKLKMGMTYEEVCEIFGFEGNLQSSYYYKYLGYSSDQYIWRSDSYYGGNVNVSFDDNKLVSKNYF